MRIDDLVAVDTARFGFEGQRDPMTKHVERNRLDVLRDHVASTLRKAVARAASVSPIVPRGEAPARSGPRSGTL